MKRSSFFKSLAALVVAPKILAKIDWTKAFTKAKPPTTRLFNDLQLLQPIWYNDFVKKYGNENFTDIMKMMGGAHMLLAVIFIIGIPKQMKSAKVKHLFLQL